MILIDVNILLYAYNTVEAQHARARSWLEKQLSGTEPVCICWAIVNAFIRIGTNPRAFARPMTLNEAVQHVQHWLNQSCVRMIAPTDAHWPIFTELLHGTQARGNLVTDAHLAAIAIEHGCELVSADADFARFPRLKWRNPLA